MSQKSRLAPYRRLLPAFVLVILIAVFFFFSSLQLVDDALVTRQAADLSRDLAGIRNGLNASQGADRGYVLTGDEKFLSDYAEKRRDVEEALDRVAALPPSIMAPSIVSKLRTDASTVLDASKQTVDIRRLRGMAAATAFIGESRGRLAMERVRASGNQVDGALKEVADVRREKLRILAWVTGIVVIGGSALLLVLLGRAALTITRSDTELAGSEERFRSLIEATSEIIWRTDPQGNFDQHQEHWQGFTGQTAEASAGRGWFDAVHRDDRDRTEERWAWSLHYRVPYRLQHRIKRADGEYRTMNVRAVPVFDERGSVREWVGIHSDVTERRRAEIELVEMKEMAEAANVAKSQFLANMSHELRTPLNAVIGYSEMLREEAEELGVAESMVPDLDRIRGAGKHLLALINDVLDLSKIEAGKMELFVEDVDVADLVREVLGTAEPLAQSNGDRLLPDLAADLGHVRTDATKIRQGLLNLLSNACKFTKDGDVHLTVRRTARDNREWLEFEIRDTGIGMSSEQMGRLFESFTQADASTTRKFGGTGLGLAITRRFARMLGGDVTVQSEAGVGSTFRMVVAAETVGTKPGETAEAADGPLILVVDDDPAARDLLSRTLTKEGYRVALAEGGDEGIALAQRLRPDAITLDVLMPRTDGWTVLHALKADERTESIPVLMLTMGDEKNLAYSLGASEFLNKPITRDRLVGALDRVRCHEPICRILLVEDDPDARMITKASLEKERWAVDEAIDGREGLKHLAAETPDVVLLDLNMPNMDGFEFAEAMRSDARWRDIPIVVLTARELNKEDRQRLNGNVQRILSKGGLDRVGLLREIRRALKVETEAA